MKVLFLIIRIIGIFYFGYLVLRDLFKKQYGEKLFVNIAILSAISDRVTEEMHQYIDF